MKISSLVIFASTLVFSSAFAKESKVSFLCQMNLVKVSADAASEAIEGTGQIVGVQAVPSKTQSTTVEVLENLRTIVGKPAVLFSGGDDVMTLQEGQNLIISSLYSPKEDGDADFALGLCKLDNASENNRPKFVVLKQDSELVCLTKCLDVTGKLGPGIRTK